MSEVDGFTRFEESATLDESTGSVDHPTPRIPGQRRQGAGREMDIVATFSGRAQ